MTVQRNVPRFCTRSICGWSLFQPLGLVFSHSKEHNSYILCWFLASPWKNDVVSHTVSEWNTGSILHISVDICMAITPKSTHNYSSTPIRTKLMASHWVAPVSSLQHVACWITRVSNSLWLHGSGGIMLKRFRDTWHLMIWIESPGIIYHGWCYHHKIAWHFRYVRRRVIYYYNNVI